MQLFVPRIDDVDGRSGGLAFSPCQLAHESRMLNRTESAVEGAQNASQIAFQESGHVKPQTGKNVRADHSLGGHRLDLVSAFPQPMPAYFLLLHKESNIFSHPRLLIEYLLNSQVVAF